jgi:Dyp-type peroxidase family
MAEAEPVLIGAGGKAIAMNLLSPIGTWGDVIRKRILYFGLHLRGPNAYVAPLLELSFVQFARWVVIPKGGFPHLTAEQPKERLEHDYLFFSSNYNGQWDQYLDAFSAVYDWGVDAMWHGSLNWVPARYTQGLKEFVKWSQMVPGNVPADHYYCAYPEATLTDIRAALAVRDALRDFVEATPAVEPPAAFASRWVELLRAVQHGLGSTGLPPIDSDLLADSYGAADPLSRGLPVRRPPFGHEDEPLGEAPCAIDLSSASDLSQVNQCGQAYGLTVLSPILAGHEAALRAVLAGLHQGPLQNEQGPFARTPTTHTARWVVIDRQLSKTQAVEGNELQSSYLLFDANFDAEVGGIDAWLASVSLLLGAEIAAIYAHCVDFTPGATNFATYIHRCQVESTFFFSDYARTLRGSAVNVQIALALQQAFIAEVADAQKAPDAATVQVSFARFVAAHGRALAETLPSPAAAPQARDELLPRAPKVALARKAIDYADLQGNIVRPYGFANARHLLLAVVDAARARAALLALARRVTTAETWTERPAAAVNVAFSYPGLVALGLPVSVCEGFPNAFRAGMKVRKRVLGDTGDSDPARWDAAWQRDVHAVVSIQGNDPAALEACDAEIVRLLDGGLRVLAREQGTARKKGGEHFGFADGNGDVDVDGTGDAGDGKITKDGWAPLAAGELLCGYTDEAGEFPESSPQPAALAANGTFLVFRKLEQRVRTFRKYLAEQGRAYPGGAEKLAAKMVGRWRDGTPLVRSPDAPTKDITNDFTYEGDPDGARCPLGAHIRRARPRDAMGFHGKLTDMRRIARRGMPYGPFLPEDDAGTDDEGRGLLFYAFNVDIERQFEFVQQQWFNYGNHFGQGNDKDILLGDHDGSGKAVIQSTGPGEAPYLCTALPRFVATRGGDYFFMPGLAALRWIADPAAWPA